LFQLIAFVGHKPDYSAVFQWNNTNPAHLLSIINAVSPLKNSLICVK
jgi:hypothetical protein